MNKKLLFLLVLLLTAATGAVAEEQVVYTLDGTQTASNTAYVTAGVINQGGITWSVTGNVHENPWRIGGKSLSGVDRPVWSENSLNETVTKVTLEFGEGNSITVNSITMTVAGDAEFSDVIDTKAVTFSANNTVDVTPTEGKEWKNAYYRFVFNVTVSSGSNKYFQLKSIKFYNDPDAQQQGGSTEPVAGTFTAALAEGTKDAKNWTITSGEKSAKGDAADGLTGLSEGAEVTVTYSGSKKVKSVKAVKAAPAKVPATVTTAPTGAAIVGVGKETALVSGGVADGGTLMYAVTTTNTKPTSTAGFSATVPTAQTITASGKVYVWYYVKGDPTHTDSEIAATAIEVTVMAVPITVTWNPSDIVPKSLSDKSFTKDGITFTAATCDFQVLTFGGGGTFTTTLGNFTKIEISADFTGNVSGTGWTNDGWQSATWTGNAASVSFSGDIWGGGMTCEGGNLTIVFTIE